MIKIFIYKTVGVVKYLRKKNKHFTLSKIQMRGLENFSILLFIRIDIKQRTNAFFHFFYFFAKQE